MHASVMTWLEERRWKLGTLTASRVLEVGSYDENGSARTIFGPLAGSYYGVDRRAGRGVDGVADAANLPFGDASFDLVICTEMLEHDARPWLSMVEMARVLRRGGHLLLTARGFDAYGGYPEHPCPDDYWRFNASSMNVLLDWASLTAVEVVPDPEAPGVFAHAVKPSLSSPPIELPPPPVEDDPDAGVREPRRPRPSGDAEAEAVEVAAPSA